MTDQPSVILSGFGDEAANQKTAEQQFAAFAALGLQYYTLRFIDAGQGIKNVMQLTKSEITKIRHLEDEYGLNVATLGSPIGKVKLLDVDDGTQEPLRAVQEVPGRRSEEGLRAGPCLRDQADPRLLVLSSQGDRSLAARAAGGRSAWADRRDVPPQRPDVRPGGRGQPRRPERRADGRDPPAGRSPGAGADLRRRQHQSRRATAPARSSSSTRR